MPPHLPNSIQEHEEHWRLFLYWGRLYMSVPQAEREATIQPLSLDELNKADHHQSDAYNNITN